jgi:hypothetical protein
LFSELQPAKRENKINRNITFMLGYDSLNHIIAP